MPRAAASVDIIDPAFVQKLERARASVRTIAYLSIMGGVFTLVFMVLWAMQAGAGAMTWMHISYVGGGAVCFALGIGLLGYSDAARGAGSTWFLAWGVANLIVGYFATQDAQMPIGIFCLISGVVQIVFADLLHLPAEVFVCSYAAGDLTPGMIEEGILKAHSDKRHPKMPAFVATAYSGPTSASA